MTFKEFRKMTHGVSDWQVYLIDNSDKHWYYGCEEVLGDMFDDKRVVSFDITAKMDYQIVCTVDLI